ncbi:MAG: CoA synthetase [Gammaproteobacteria bacterium]|nr:CoA synthetase [Gammaproteobacteria bacterium]
MTECQLEELLIHTIAEDLVNRQHVAVGASSPIPASAALLARQRNPSLQVSLLGSEKHTSFTDGGRELFDCAAQGRIDTFFLSGIQIDGKANVNLVGIGDYPGLKKRFAGSFGSAYLYDLVPNVILFCWAHSLTTLVQHVDFISAAGPLDNNHYRPGGPTLLITDRCLFRYRATQRGFSLVSVHEGQTVEDIVTNTAFTFEVPEQVPTTTIPDGETLGILREEIKQQMLDVYPVFAKRLWN